MRANDCYRAFYGSVNYNELELKTFDVPVNEKNLNFPILLARSFQRSEARAVTQETLKKL